jgi:phenylalanyl-tRNA synthetase beta chain
VVELNGLGDETDGSNLLTIKNPLREEESKLRPTLLAGLLNDLRYNQSHGNASVGLFELGKVFFSEPHPGESRLPHEYDRLAWAVVGEVGPRGLDGAPFQADAAFSLGLWRLLARSLDLDAKVTQATRPGFHPGRTAEITMGDRVLGHVGELAPATARFFEVEGRVAVAELDLEPLLSQVPDRLSTTPSTFPHVDFDLSFLVPEETSAAELLAATTGAASGLVESARVFDEFRGGTVGEGRKALAISYRLRAPDRTLEQKEIGSIRQTMIEAATAAGATLRGAG